jgi:hypothetical protein
MHPGNWKHRDAASRSIRILLFARCRSAAKQQSSVRAASRELARKAKLKILLGKNRVALGRAGALP